MTRVDYGWTVALLLIFIFGFMFVAMIGYSAIIVKLFDGVYTKHLVKNVAGGWLKETQFKTYFDQAGDPVEDPAGPNLTDDVLKFVLPSFLYLKVTNKAGAENSEDEDLGAGAAGGGGEAGGDDGM
eukprot:g4197.t1